VVFRGVGGPTDLDDLVLLCDHHHRLVHYRGWKLTLHPDGALTARYGRSTYTTRPNTTGVRLRAGPPPAGRPPRQRRPPRRQQPSGAALTGTPGDADADADNGPRRSPERPPGDLPF
jgi:hypothetical protein